jgi:hypothetical protein
MGGVVAKIIKETNWTAVNVIGAFAFASVMAFASVKSDVRDLGTNMAALQKQSEINGAEIAKLRDAFVNRGITYKEGSLR